MSENIRVVIDADASDLERELRKAGIQVNTFGRETTGASRGVSAFNAVVDQQGKNLRQLSRYTMYAGAGIATFVSGVAAYSVKEGIQFNATMESNRMALAQFLGSTKEADKFLNQLFDTAKKGPFQFAQITEAARKLLAFEFNKKEATDTLNAISDSVAALGGSADVIDRVVIAMGQIQAKGRVQGDELLQLAEAGIPAYQILRDELGLTADEVKNIGDAGITADQAIKALTEGMEDRFGGAAQRQAKTFAGQMSTLEDNFDQLMGAMTEGLFNEMKDWLPVVNQTAEDIAAIWNRDDITPEQKFKESRKVAERELGPLVDEIGQLIDKADLPEKFGDILSKALPVAAEAGGKLGVVVAKSTVEGFLASNIWGKVLIGGWLFTKMGGFAAIRASGAKVGAEAAAGMAEGMASSTAAGGAGGLLAKAGGFARSAGKMGLWGLAITGGIEAADILVNNSADNAMARLEQLDQQGKGLLGTFDREILNPAFDVVSKITGEDNSGSLSNQGDAAHRLKEILAEVNQVGMVRGSQLRDEGRQLLENLDITQKEKGELRAILDLKPRKATDAQAGIDKLASGQITRMQDIRKQMRENSLAAAQAFGSGSNAWRSASARNINAAVQAIRKGMRDGVIETRKGKAEIRALLAKRDLLTGSDPVGLAQGFRRSWGNAGKINQQSINRIINQLDQMPKGARNKAAQMLIQMARQMEKDRKLPEGSMSKLRSAIVSNLDTAVKQGNDRIKKLQGSASSGAKGWSAAFEDFAKGVDDGMGKAGRSLDQGQRNTDRAMDRMERRAKGLTAGVGGSFKRLPSPVAAGISSTVAKVNAGLQAVGSDELIELAFASGGMMRVPGTGTADSVPLVGSGIKAVVAPGEDLAVFNRHQRPMVDAALQNTYGVSGLGGFFSKYDRPHYMARGGMAGDDFNLPKATLTGTPDTAREMGQKGLDEFHKYALKYYKAHAKVVSGGNIVEVGHSLQRLGYEVSENPAFGGVAPVHAEGSYHYSGRAIDVNDDAAPYGHGSSEKSSLDWLYPQLQKLPHVELLWQVADHFDHLHFAMNRGGLFRGFQFLASGGKTSKGIWEGTSIDKSYPKSNGYTGYKMPPYLIKALAEWAGLPGVTMEQITQGESMGHPGVDISDPPGRSRGLYAINDHYNPSYGASDMRNPILNTMAAADLARAAGGPNANIWHGSGHVTGWNLHYDADPEKLYRIAKSLGGGGGGGDGEDNATANRLKSRKKALADLRGRAKKTNNPKAREQILWQLIDAYARWGDFDRGKGKKGNRFNEWRHLRDVAYNIAAMKNPNMGAGKLSQLAKWLDNHVEITGREKENAGLERRLENTRERGGRKAGKRRKSFYKRLVRDIAGLDPYERNWFKFNTDQIERLEEQISLAEQQHSGAWSEGGSDYTEKEIAREVDLNTRLKERMASRIGKYSSALAAARGYKSIFESKIAQARKDPKQRWKIPAFRRGLKQAEAALTRLRGDRETMIGVTGKGGDFRQVKFRLQELGVMDSTEDQAAAARDSELNTILKEQLIQSQRGFALGQAQYAVFKDFLGGVDSPFLGAFAMGTAGRRVGRTGLAVLHENEVVTPDPKGPYGQNMSTVGSSSAAPRVEITVAGDVAPLLNKVEAIVDGKTAQVVRKVNSELGRERRQLAYAPGR